MSARIFLCFISLAAFVLTGCESLPSRIDRRFDSVPPQVHEYDGTVEQVYVAAQKAFRRLDFNVTRSSLGRIEAASAIRTSTPFADSRQLIARVTIHQSGPAKAEVELSLTQDVSSQSIGGTHSTAVRENGFFSMYFTALQQVLQDQASLPEAGKK